MVSFAYYNSVQSLPHMMHRMKKYLDLPQHHRQKAKAGKNTSSWNCQHKNTKRKFLGCLSPVPLVSLIHAVQLEDWAPDHWKFSFHKFPVFSFGLQFCMISLTNLACPVEAGFGHYPWNVHEESIDQLTNYKTTHHFGNPTSAFVNLLLTPHSPATQILAKKIPLHLKVERSLRDCRDCPVSSSSLGSL